MPVGVYAHRRGEQNHRWREDSTNYATMHGRVKRARGRPKICERCGTSDPSKTYDWANLTGNYKDINDYSRMCRSCHRLYDISRGIRIGPNAHKTACFRGHPFDEANTKLVRLASGKIGRVCRICQRVRDDARRARRAAVKAHVKATGEVVPGVSIERSESLRVQ